MDTISTKQRAVLDLIKKHLDENPYPPTVRELAEKMNLASPATIHAHIKNLALLGFLEKDEGRARSLMLTDKALALYESRAKINLRNFGSRSDAASSEDEQGVPLLGQVAAGSPILAEENIEDYYTLPSQYQKDGNFLLRVQGDSMIEAGIFAGDLIIVKQQNTANNGEIVVALLDEEATVKTIYFEEDGIRLQPANSAYRPIYTTEARILGRVIGLLRMGM